MGNEARQIAILRAIGIDVYRLRESEAAGARPAGEPGSGAPASSDGTVLLVIAAAAATLRDRRIAQRIGQLARAIGAAQAQTRTVDIGAAAAVAALPEAPAYLMIGAAAARACSAQMPIARQQAAAIAVVDDLEGTTGAAARRVLWQTLKPLARRVRAGAG